MGEGGQRNGLTAWPPPPHAEKETSFPSYRKLGGPQGLSVRVRKITPPLGFDSRIAQSVVMRNKNVEVMESVFLWEYVVVSFPGYISSSTTWLLERPDGLQSPVRQGSKEKNHSLFGMESKLLHYIASHFADLDITAFYYEGIMLEPCKAESALYRYLM
jgi:hypothetical protein